jgi:WXG100 family type VII secretion target
MIEVRYGGVHNVGEAFIDAAKALRQMLDQMDQQITASGMNTYWQGAAQLEYATVKANWDQILDSMTAALNGMVQMLEEIAQSYQAADTNIAMNWQAIR